MLVMFFCQSASKSRVQVFKCLFYRYIVAIFKDGHHVYEYVHKWLLSYSQVALCHTSAAAPDPCTQLVSAFVSLDHQASLHDCHGILPVSPHRSPIGSSRDRSHMSVRGGDRDGGARWIVKPSSAEQQQIMMKWWQTRRG